MRGLCCTYLFAELEWSWAVRNLGAGGLNTCHHHSHAAVSAGTKKMTAKIGHSSVNEYPARYTPNHILTAATISHSGMNSAIAMRV